MTAENVKVVDVAISIFSVLFGRIYRYRCTKCGKWYKVVKKEGKKIEIHN